MPGGKRVRAILATDRGTDVTTLVRVGRPSRLPSREIRFYRERLPPKIIRSAG